MKLLHDVIVDALKDAGLRDRVQREEIAVILSMISRGASLEDAVLHQADSLQGALSGLGSVGLIRGNTAPGLRPWISFAREARAKGHK